MVVNYVFCRAFVRRISLVFVLSGLGTGPALAQWFNGTLLIGVSSTTLSGESVIDFSSKAAFMGGVGLGIQLNEYWTIQPELLYISKGADGHTDIAEMSRLLDIPYDEADADVPVTLGFDLVYIDIPLLVIYRFNSIRRIQPRLFAGPSVGIKLDATVEFGVEGSGPTFTEQDDSVQDLDYGLVVGAGVDLPLGLEKVTIGIRTLLGRANTREREPAIRNRGFAFTVGMMF